MTAWMTAGALLAAGVLSALAPAHAAELSPRIYGGSPAEGDPAVVRITQFDGSGWPAGCSGAMLRPRLVLTAAHCMTIDGTGEGVAGFALFAPGSSALFYSDIGPQGAANVNVVNSWKPDGYRNVNDRVQPNDIAVLQLDADLGAAAFARIASQFDIALALSQRQPVQHLGYGLVSPGQFTRVPFSTTLPLTLAALVPSEYGWYFSTEQSASSGTCPGDSGSPAFLNTAAGRLLIGDMAGGNAPCSSVDTYSNVGFQAIHYLDMLNSALAAAGYPTIPSAPQDVRVTARNRDLIVTWKPPTTSPQTVVGYDVLDPTGVVRCQTATTTCTITGQPDGAYAYAVRSRNAEGEGDALPIPGGALQRGTVRPPAQMSAPTAKAVAGGKVKVRFTTLAGVSSAVVTSYIVRDGRGKAVCTIKAPDPSAWNYTCTTKPKPGLQRYTVQAVTEMGTTPLSRPSTRVRVR